MKNKKYLLYLFLVLLILVTSCASGSGPEESKNNVVSSTEGMVTVTEDDGTRVLSVDEFEKLLQTLPLAVVDQAFSEGDDKLNFLYPSKLQAIIRNNTSLDIKDAEVAFVAWDENDLPIKIEGQLDFYGGNYYKRVSYSDINLVPNEVFGYDYGYALSDSMKISRLQAIALSFETFNGEKWENPYTKEFKELFEGKKYNADSSVEVKIKEVEEAFKALEFANYSSDNDNDSKEHGDQEDDSSGNILKTDKEISREELDGIIAQQELAVIVSEYIIQSEDMKLIYPDMLNVILKNNTDDDIKDAIIAFVAWDKNGLPVKIKGQFDFTDGSYLKRVNYNDINTIPGDTFGDNYGLLLDEHTSVTDFKAIVESFETFEGEVWKNPFYGDFKKLYEGKKY
ncbi:MAG: hypothetical protein GX666_08625 [Tissierellia bacterium]|nr:hypothetical protein [Tissierellia bacterium]